MPRTFTFQPVGFDIFDRRPSHPEPGTRVVKVQPSGCPKNGTMGHCYVADAETGAFYGLVLENSLRDMERERQLNARTCRTHRELNGYLRP